MAITVSGTSITFNDATTQTTAAVSGQLQSQIFYSSGSWTAPTGVTKVRVALAGGGGGTSRSGSCCNVGTGGRGGFIYAMVTVSPGTSYTVTVGAGGNGAGSNANGAIATSTAGTTTSFGALASATGGQGASCRGNCPSFNGTGAAGTATTTGTVIKQNQASFTLLATLDSGPQTQTGTAASTTAYSPGVAGGTYNVSGTLYGQAGTGGVVFLEWVG